MNVAGVDGKFWSGMTECPKGSFVSGFRTKKFGANSRKGNNKYEIKEIELKCKDTSGNITGYDMILSSDN